MANGPRVMVLGWSDALGESALSGMPFNMRRGLQSAGCDISIGRVGTLDAGTGCRSGPDRPFTRIKAKVRRCVHAVGQVIRTESIARDLERRAVRAARLADRAIEQGAPDVVFGPCMSIPIGFMQTKVPIVYASDATAHLLQATYGTEAGLENDRTSCATRFETLTLTRADRIAVASQSTARSAIEHHGADPDRVSVVPLGANVEPRAGEVCIVPAPAPTVDGLELLLTAADPERKRLGLCVAITRELRARGWNAILHYIGPRRPECDEEFVVWAGRLKLGDPVDAERHRHLLRNCHLALLPSVAEMYGISPIESAAYGRPAVVSDAGGLPTVVEDGRTGRVVPVETPVAGWADAIESTVGPRERYEAFSIGAFRRQQEALNWRAWGASVRRLCEEVC